MDFTYTLELNEHTNKALKEMPDTVLFNVAKITLDNTYTIIPKNTKRMALETFSNGVRGGNGDFYLESSPGYASHVWNMNDDTTNWTTPGTHSQWFARTLAEHGKIIIDMAVNQSWKEKM